MPLQTRATENSTLSRRGVLALVLAPALYIARSHRGWAQTLPAPPTANAAKLIAAAARQIGVTTRYDPAYERLTFPGGDVALERGVCTDVIVRAYRQAFNTDLQALINADMRIAFSAYPRTWGLARPDSNIDHRRVQNMQVFFKRQGAAQPVPADVGDWQPGDLVTQLVPAERPHVGIVSATRDAASGRWLVIHNIGRGAEASDILTLYKPTGRYRFRVG